MSGDEVPRGPARPIDLTDDEVAQLAGARGSRVAALTRMKAAVPTGPVGTLETRAAQPAKLSKAEIAAVQKQGRLPEKVAARLALSELPAAAPEPDGGPELPVPTEVPPSARKTASARKSSSKTSKTAR